MGLFDAIRKQATGFASAFTNGNVQDAALAACALITLADGEKEDEEVAAGKRVILKYDKFDGLTPDQRRAMAARYEDYCNQAADPFDRLDLLEKVAKLRGKDEAHTVVNFAVIVANSDGEYEPEEKDAVREICGRLNLNPAEFGA